MSTAYVTEFLDLQRLRSHDFAPIVQYPPITNQSITFTTNVQSDAFSEICSIILLQCEDDCFYEVGENPEATTGSTRLPASVKERYIGVKPGHKIAFYDGAS